MVPPRRPPSLLAAALIIILLSAAGPAAAIYEDQAGTFDWYKQFVGRPQSVLFSPGKERVFLSTQQNLLASLHTRGGGAVAWRRHYPQPQDSLDGVLLLHSPSLALAASNGGKTLRAWDALDGGFRWEALVYEGPAVAGSPGLTAVPLEGHKYPPVAVAAGNTIKLLSAAKGEELWAATLDDAAADASHKLLLAVGTEVALAAYTPGSRHLAVVTYAAADGTSSGQVQEVSAAAELGSTAAISGSSLAVLSEDGQQLCVLQSPGAGGVSCERLSSLAPRLGGSSSQLRLAAAAPGSFVVSSAAGVALISVSSSGAMEQVHWAAGAAAAPAATAGTSSATADAMGVVAASADASNLSIQLLSAASGEQLETAELQLPAPTYPLSGPAATVVTAWLDASKRKDTSSSSSSSSSGGVLSGCRLLVLWSDDQLTYIEDGEVVWSREEALASVSSSLISELPSAKGTLSSGEEQDDSSSSSSSTSSSSGKGGLLGLLQDRQRLKQWVRLQVLGVYVQFKLNSDAEKEEFYALRQALSDNNLPSRDTNGFRKLIVVLTGPGKVFGLHSGDGRILWASNAAALPTAAASSSSSSGSGSSKQYLRVWRRFHDLTHAPQVVVLTAGQHESGAHVLNAHTGQQLQHIELPYGVEKVIPVQAPVHDGAAEQFSFLLVEQQQHPTDSSDDSDQLPTPRVHVVPDTPSVTAAVAAGASNTFFWLQQQQQEADATTADTVLQGFSLVAGAEADGKGLLPVVPAWRVVLPGKLLSLASRDPTEPVHSYVKILGDRSLKYKYINPNLLFVATAPSSSPTASAAAAAAASGGKAVPAEEQQVSVALINTVSGAVLHQQVHTGAAGPVHAAVSEHWVVYTLWDVVNLRQQVSVIELYDASPRDLSIESILLGRTQHAERLSSYSQLSLEVLSQSFYLQHAVTGLGVSQTLQGITTKQLLLHTQSQQLYALDKRYLDPRRPVAAKSTPQQAEEGLLPYSELVIFNTLMYPTQDKQVMNLRGVSSAPAVLESTSLLFCYGSDLFFTRITPAAHFDSLQSDFSYGLLVVALLGLTVGTLVMRRTSENAMVKAKWQ